MEKMITITLRSSRDDSDLAEHIDHLVRSAVEGSIGDPHHYRDIDVIAVQVEPSRQMLITLDDNRQVILSRQPEGVEIHYRDRPSDTWSLSFEQSDKPHQRGTFFFGPYG